MTSRAIGQSLGVSVLTDQQFGSKAGWRAASPLIKIGRDFLGDFASYAGRDGVRAALLVVVGALLENIGIVLLVPLVALMTIESGATGKLEHLAASLFAMLDAETRLQRVSVLLALFSALVIARALVIAKRNRALARLRIGYAQSLRLRVLRGLARARWDQVTGLRHARVSHVLGGDIDRVGSAAFTTLDAGVAVVALASHAILALWLAPVFAAASMALVAVAALGFGPIIRRGYDLGVRLTRKQLDMAHWLGQLLGGLKQAMSQNLQAVFVDEFEISIAEATRRQIEFFDQHSSSQLAWSTMAALAGAACAFVGVGVMEMSAALIIPLLLILARMSGPAIAILRGAQYLVNCLPAHENLRALEADLAPARRDGAPAGASAMDVDGAIEFRDVSFSHDDGDGAPDARSGGVANLNFRVARDEILGVTGPSGAGKTTFADLLVGLHAPRTGVILVGGTPLTDAGLAPWRAALGYVSQDPFLFHDTIRRNLAWANPGAGDDDMWSALALAGAEDFVRATPGGLDTIVGERGALVSGGERQRIALARALLRRPRLLILDEATSALDIAAERRILENVRRLTPPPTIIVIAHRPESLTICDRVLRFENGRLAPPPASMEARA